MKATFSLTANQLASHPSTPPASLPLSAEIYQAYCADESSCLRQLLSWYTMSDDEKIAAHDLAKSWIEQARAHEQHSPLLQQLLKEYSLATEEGVALMCLAEALIRVPDKETAQLLLEDKLNQRNWQQHIHQHSSLWLNASSWGLLLSGKIFQHKSADNTTISASEAPAILTRLVRKIGGPIAYKAIQQAIQALGQQFIFASDIQSAEQQTHANLAGFNFDLLGESALTSAEAAHYQQNYFAAIDYLAKHNPPDLTAPIASLSVKLSALHPRFESLQPQALSELGQSLQHLARHARQHQIALFIDAEECSRLEPTLNLYAQTVSDAALADWPYLGLAVQAYQKRALAVLQWLKQLGQNLQMRLPIRLVKGAYWDSEIKYAQQYGLVDYPVFTQKAQTDISYLACAQFMLQHPAQFYGYFASHNAYTLASIVIKAHHLQVNDFRIQRLHGMGESIFQAIRATHPQIPQNIYAPIGHQKVLLPYLVRRLLENGTNGAFLNLFNRPQVNSEELIIDPQTLLAPHYISTPSSAAERLFLSKPCNLYQPERRQMPLVNLHNAQEVEKLGKQLQLSMQMQHVGTDQDQSIRNPANTRQVLGSRSICSAKDLVEYIDKAHQFFPHWTQSSAELRAQCLVKLASLLEQHTTAFITLLMTEAGKTLANALQEIREATDFCRYYAAQCLTHFSKPQILPGPTGELNTLSYEGRGVVICISPWNFPLAILIGQITAALAAGNCVIAKPATHGELIARQVAELVKLAGFPEGCCYFTPCSARVFATVALSDSKIAGVCFTGSLDTAQHIQRELAQREGPIAFMSAETGGQNAMIVDSTALPEQVVMDAITSAFDSAGQRCSALRVLCLQNDIAPQIIDQLLGRMELLRVGNPLDLQTDIGPVINEAAQKKIQAHINWLSEKNLLLGRTPLDTDTEKNGYFVSPALIEIDHINILKQEIFGPVLHILRYDKQHLPQLLQQINATGYGLTLGIHTRIDGRAQQIAKQIRCGNIYINRSMIGAVVGSQPFGGMGLSGSGHKSGGPDTLLNLCHRKCISNNLTAIGGNPNLLSTELST